MARRRTRRGDFIDRMLPRFLRSQSTGRRNRKRDLDDGGVPVEPNRPSTLSGGAAAALEFDEDA